MFTIPFAYLFESPALLLAEAPPPAPSENSTGTVLLLMFAAVSYYIMRNKRFPYAKLVIGLILSIGSLVAYSSRYEIILGRNVSKSDYEKLIMLCGVACLMGVILIVSGIYSMREANKLASVAPSQHRGMEERLRQLDELRAKNLITEVEYQERRRSIMDSL